MSPSHAAAPTTARPPPPAPAGVGGAAVVIAEINNKIGNTLGTALLEPLPTVVSQYSHSANETGVAKVINKYDTSYSHRIKYPHSL